MKNGINFLQQFLGLRQEQFILRNSVICLFSPLCSCSKLIGVFGFKSGMKVNVPPSWASFLSRQVSFDSATSAWSIDSALQMDVWQAWAKRQHCEKRQHLQQRQHPQSSGTQNFQRSPSKLQIHGPPFFKNLLTVFFWHPEVLKDELWTVLLGMWRMVLCHFVQRGSFKNDRLHVLFVKILWCAPNVCVCRIEAVHVPQQGSWHSVFEKSHTPRYRSAFISEHSRNE